jgi:hypothetical protein
MIIDVHTHAFPDALAPRALPLPEADREKIFSGSAKRILGI